MIWENPRLIELATVRGVSAGNCNAGDKFTLDDCDAGGGAQGTCTSGPYVGSSGTWCWPTGSGADPWPP